MGPPIARIKHKVDITTMNPLTAKARMLRLDGPLEGIAGLAPAEN